MSDAIALFTMETRADKIPKVHLTFVCGVIELTECSVEDSDVSEPKIAGKYASSEVISMFFGRCASLKCGRALPDATPCL